MRLAELVERKFDGNVAAFARALGRSQGAARKWLLPVEHPDRTLPDEASVIRIYQFSGGAVTPNDLYPLPRLRVRRRVNGAR